MVQALKKLSRMMTNRFCPEFSFIESAISTILRCYCYFEESFFGVMICGNIHLAQQMKAFCLLIVIFVKLLFCLFGEKNLKKNEKRYFQIEK